MGIKINNDKDPYFNEPGFPMERIGPGIFFFGGKKMSAGRLSLSGSDGQLLNWPSRRRKRGVW